MGLSFAIPIEMAMNVAEQLKTKGRVTRGWLGVLIQDITRELADSFGMDHPKGALVAKVLPDSPASAAGLQPGDVILKYNGREITSSSKLPPLVGASRIGRPAQVDILRGGKQRTLRVEIGELPQEEAMEQAAATPKKSEASSLGLTVSDVTEQIEEQLGVQSGGGVLVEMVAPGPAKAAGIQQGDIIQMINNVGVKNISEFNAQLQRLPKGRTTAVLVLRGSGPMFLAMRVPGD